MYPGSFDPPTFGHLDVIRRGSILFDSLIIAIAVSDSKKYNFSVDERVDMMKQITDTIENVEVLCFNGMTVDFVRERGCNVILRGVRTVADFEYEFRMASTNRKIAQDIETIFVMPEQEFSFFSSKMAREVAALGGPLEYFVPEPIVSFVRERLHRL